MCMRMGTLFRALAFAVENSEQKYNYLCQKSVEVVSNNWDLLAGAFEVGVIPQNITTKEKFKSYM